MNKIQTIAIALAALAPTASLADFAGGYAGLSYGISTTNEASLGSMSIDLEDDGAIGIFGGFRAQSGDLVYGGELAISNVSNLNEEGGSSANDIDVTITDLKGTVGYDLSGFLAYGILGFSSFSASEDVASSDTATGFSLGAGVAYEVAPNVEVGAEYLVRRAEFEDDVELSHDTFSFRVAYSF